SREIVGINKNLLGNIGRQVKSGLQEAYKKAHVDNYYYSALEFVNNDDFIYINGGISASEAEHKQRGGIQVESVKPGEEIVSQPWFFENWRTHHYDIVVQGKSDTFYVFDENGKLRWKKQLDGPIIGNIQPIDIYHNKRIQMAF